MSSFDFNRAAQSDNRDRISTIRASTVRVSTVRPSRDWSWRSEVLELASQDRASGTIFTLPALC